MQLRAFLALTLGLVTAPIAGVAHPHVFVDTQLRVVVGNDGVFKGVEVTWTYDDFYSLLLLSDYGLDNDGDGKLNKNDSLVGEVKVDGPCRATQIPADLDAAYTLVEELLYVIPSSDIEEAYPEVGEAFADTVTLSCAG